MSRIGKQPIQLPAGVTAAIKGRTVTVKGPKGELTFTHHPLIKVAVSDGALVCTVATSAAQGKRLPKHAAALWGTTRARLASMVHGVAEGWQKQLELQGVGYRAAVKGKTLELLVGFSHPVTVTPPEGITLAVDKEIITVSGADACLVGQVAANIRAVRKPEPYKGKGIRYVGELVRRKVGKVMGTTAGAAGS